MVLLKACLLTLILINLFLVAVIFPAFRKSEPKGRPGLMILMVVMLLDVAALGGMVWM